MKNDKLFEENREIRKLANNGLTIEEVGAELYLTKPQIKPPHFKSICFSILKKLFGNKESCKNLATDISKEASIPLDNSSVIVIDTSALHDIYFFETLSKYEKVLIPTHVILQLDSQKKAPGIYGKNIRTLAKLNIQDTTSKRYESVPTLDLDSNLHTYNEETDLTLIRLCKDTNYTLYTGDYFLAGLAKAYFISYILVKKYDKLLPPSANTTVEETCFMPDVNKLHSSIGSSLIEFRTISNVSLLGKFLVLNLPNSQNIDYIVCDEKRSVKHPEFGNFIKLHIDDLVYVITFPPYCLIQLINFQIVSITETNHAEYVKTYKIKDLDDFSNLPSYIAKQAKIILENHK